MSHVSRFFLFASSSMFALGLVAASAALATNIVVTSYLDPTDTTCTLRQAVTAANTNASVGACVAGSPGNDTIDLTALNGTITLTAGEIPILENLVVLGPVLPQVTISGNNASRAFHVGTGSGPSLTVTISRLTFVDGDSPNGGAIYNESGNTLRVVGSTFTNNHAGNGGAILNFLSTLLVVRSLFDSNDTTGGGGAIWSNAGSVTVRSSQFIGNKTGPTGDGGAIFSVQGPVTILTSAFDGNEALGGAPQAGGAIHALGGVTWPISIRDSSFTNNRALSAGGAVYTYGGAFTVRKSTFIDNSTPGEGGAISKTGPGNTDIANSTFEGNDATANGGAMAVVFADALKIRRSTFAENTAVGDGGALLVQYCSAPGLIANCTMHRNSGANGGGIFVTGQLAVANTTITESLSGHGIYSNLVAGTSQSIKVRNTIVADNVPVDCFGPIVTKGHNLESGNNTCTFSGAGDLINTAANLGPLASNGGPTQTRQLLGGSALDGGSPLIGGSTGCLVIDQRGVPRPYGPACDIGAYEAVYTGCPDGNTVGIEQCDDGNLDPRDGCTTTCTICGNGVVSAPEQCDDGNVTDGDGCAANCQLVDHFTRYQTRLPHGTARFTPVLGVSLVDRFGPLTVDLKKGAGLLAATSKDAQDLDAPSHRDYLRQYVAKSQNPFAAIPNRQVTTALGTETIDVLKPAYLLVPTDDALASLETPYIPSVDHFACYKVRRAAASPAFVPVLGVTLEDGFGESRVDLKKITGLCVPANVGGQSPGAENHPGVLLCYKTGASRGADKFVAASGIALTNELASELVDVPKQRELCLPATITP